MKWYAFQYLELFIAYHAGTQIIYRQNFYPTFHIIGALLSAFISTISSKYTDIVVNYNTISFSLTNTRIIVLYIYSICYL